MPGCRAEKLPGVERGLVLQPGPLPGVIEVSNRSPATIM